MPAMKTGRYSSPYPVDYAVPRDDEASTEAVPLADGRRLVVTRYQRANSRTPFYGFARAADDRCIPKAKEVASLRLARQMIAAGVAIAN